jgi:glycosyltransferase involved in cell wall biosynthesis
MADVSVVIPLYNKGPYILRALSSVARQSCQDWEVIVVNDGSTDNSGALAESFRDPRVRVIHQTNAGPGAARNHGIAETKTPLVAFLDADDEWLPEYLETAVRAFSANPALGCLTQGFFDEPGMRPSQALWRSRGLADGVQLVQEMTPLTLHYLLAYLNSQSTVARTELVRKWGGFYENRCTYGEDAFLWLKFMLREQVALSMRETMVIHREASDLNFPGMKKLRPIEPFLDHPEAALKVCPPNLLQQLRNLYTLRAFKTACLFGYYGQWQRAAQIRRQFRQPGDYRIPWYFSSWVCSTPIGATAGAAWRALIAMRPGSARKNSTLSVSEEPERQPVAR